MNQETQKHATRVVLLLLIFTLLSGTAAANSGAKKDLKRPKRTEVSKTNSNVRTVDTGSTPKQSGADANKSTPDKSADATEVASTPTVQERIDGLEQSRISRQELWPFGFLANQIGIGLLVAAIAAMVLLHLVQLVHLRSLKRRIIRVGSNLTHSLNVRTAGSDNNVLTQQLLSQVNDLTQGVNNLAARSNQLQNEITDTSSQYRDAAQAVALTADWIASTQLRATANANCNEVSEVERGSTIALLESIREPLRTNASRLEAPTLALRDLSRRTRSASQSSPQVVGRIQQLLDDISRFDQLQQQVDAELTSLQEDSFTERRARLRAAQTRLHEELNGGSLSIDQFVQRSRSLLDQYFPVGRVQQSHEALSLSEKEAKLKREISQADDHLMDWYNNLFQLRSQLNQTPGALEAVTVADLEEIQQLAREALSRFDIQPEAIQIGNTSFDRRLHEATLVRPAPQYAANTVIDVHKCGFRRMSTGEVLRRPEVVVAGTVAG